MKRVTVLFAAGTFAVLAGCGTGGIEFNGQGEVTQFPIRSLPIIHYNLPTENLAVADDPELDYQFYDPIDDTTFQELPSPGHDLWGQLMNTYQCSDNPTCRTIVEVPDWQYMFNGGYVQFGLTGNVVWPPAGSWPHAQTAPGGTHDHRIAGWIMGIMNQWFLRNVDGTPILPPLVGLPPVQYDQRSFSSMPISIHEVSQAVSPFSQLLANTPPGGVQAETGAAGSVGANGVARVQPPINNVLGWGFKGNAAPDGLICMGWQESWAENNSIESEVSSVGNVRCILHNVPVPDYQGGGSVPSTSSGGGGVYMGRFIDNWWQTTSGNSNVPIDNGLLFSYYAAVVGSHLMGYGVGLIDSAFTLPGVQNDQEDIMVQSVMQDMSAFIAAEKEFQFTPEDLTRMQDIIKGTFEEPGPRSTLPGSDRGP